MLKVYFFTDIVGIDLPVMIDGMTITQRADNPPIERMTLQWTPATLAENTFFSNRPRRLGTHNGDVGT